MTYHERLQEARRQHTDEETRTLEQQALDDLLLYAYYVGREDSARDICDKANARYQEQRRRATECRYYNMAIEIVGEPDDCTGGRGFVYSTDYSQGWQEAFSDMIWGGN